MSQIRGSWKGVRLGHHYDHRRRESRKGGPEIRKSKSWPVTAVNRKKSGSGCPLERVERDPKKTEHCSPAKSPRFESSLLNNFSNGEARSHRNDSGGGLQLKELASVGVRSSLYFKS